jgi:hypothetical protein
MPTDLPTAMPTDLQPPVSKDQYADTLAKLAGLSRSMLLAFRLEVGKLILDEFFGGSAHAYRDRNPGKESSFAEFVRTCQAELADLGLAPAVVRQCVQARIAWDGLPQQVRDRLLFSHVVELSRVGDPTARARLAMDTTLQGWTTDQLRDAIARVHAGSYYDTDPEAPGTQPPAETPAPERGYQPGRLVTQLVKAGEDLQSWRQAWATVDAQKLRGPQRQRMVEAVAALRAQVEQLQAELGAGEG